jgi:hypothetical protein
MSKRSTPRQGEVESVEISALVDEAKRAEREGRWSDASARYEALVRNPFANDETRLCALRWLGRRTWSRESRRRDRCSRSGSAAATGGSKSAIAHALNVVAIASDRRRSRPRRNDVHRARRRRSPLATHGHSL